MAAPPRRTAAPVLGVRFLVPGDLGYAHPAEEAINAWVDAYLRTELAAEAL